MLKKAILFLLAMSFSAMIGCGHKDESHPQTTTESKNAQPNERAKAEVTTEPHWDQVASNISLQAKVTKEIDSSNSKPDEPEYMYRVEVNLKNTGGSTVLFDMAEVAFVPGEGDPMLARTAQGIDTDGRGVTRTAFSRRGEPPPRPKEELRKVEVIRLTAGKEKQWGYDTGGDTTDLLNRSKAGPLMFRFSLLSNEAVVAGPFQAALPDLDKLSLSGKDKGAQSRDVYLKFK
ncbi:MAG: hypothetical protein AB1631_06900 [Acidobacteriota bacterium]